jgi:hypothetical protein
MTQDPHLVSVAVCPPVLGCSLYFALERKRWWLWQWWTRDCVFLKAEMTANELLAPRTAVLKILHALYLLFDAEIFEYFKFTYNGIVLEIHL